MFFAVKPVSAPAFNYMVPGPHPYIMGDSNVAPMHGDIVHYNGFGEVSLSDINRVSSEYPYIKSGVNFYNFLQQVATIAVEERTKKGLPALPAWKMGEYERFKETSLTLTDKYQYVMLLDELQVWTRDIEAPIARKIVRNVKSGTEQHDYSLPADEKSSNQNQYRYNFAIGEKIYTLDLKDRTTQIVLGIAAFGLFTLIRESK